MTPRFTAYLVILLIVAGIGFVRFRRLTTPFRWLTVMILFTLVCEIISRVLAHSIKNSSPIYHIYVPVQFCFLIVIYAYFFERSNWKTVTMICVASGILSALNSFYLQGFKKLPSNAVLLVSCLLITSALLLYKRMLAIIEDENILKSSRFWFNTGILAFYTLTFFYWGIYNTMLKNKIKTAPIASAVYWMNIAFYLILGFALLIDEKRVRIVSHERIGK